MKVVHMMQRCNNAMMQRCNDAAMQAAQVLKKKILARVCNCKACLTFHKKHHFNWAVGEQHMYEDACMHYKI